MSLTFHALNKNSLYCVCIAYVLLVDFSLGHHFEETVMVGDFFGVCGGGGGGGLTHLFLSFQLIHLILN